METQNTGQRLNELLDEYLSGSISKASLDELTSLAETSVDSRRYIRERLELWYSAGVGAETPAIDLDAKYESLREQMGKGAETVHRHVVHRRIMKAVAVAAAVALVVLLPWAAYRQGARNVRNSLGTIAMQTPAGSQTRVSLPDGTVVWLNADSRITCSQGFGVNDRQVKLTGEAFFDVAHNANLPFEIDNNELDLKVLGTKFTYTAYPNDPVIKIDLIDGKVFLHNNIDGSGLTLSPNERVVYDRTNHKMTRSRIDTSMSATWTTGRLYFDDMPLCDIAATLSRTYNIKVRVADRISKRRFYGSFDSNTNSVEDVLRMISTTNKVKYRYERGAYVLY